jgi:hypothetical protein
VTHQASGLVTLDHPGDEQLTTLTVGGVLEPRAGRGAPGVAAPLGASA